MKINKILVSQPRPASEKSPYFEIADKYGVEIVFRPFIKVEGLSAKEFRQQKVSILDPQRQKGHQSDIGNQEAKLSPYV